MFRILTKIPYLALLIYGIFLLCFIAFLIPFGTEGDEEILIFLLSESPWKIRDVLNFHLLFSSFLFFIFESFEISVFYAFRSLNLIYFSLLILTLYKIIKLQFYDLEIIPTITALTCTGIIFLSFISLNGVLFVGFLSLVIFYFQLKFFIEENIFNSFFLGLFCIVALCTGSYFFLIIVTTLSLLKLLDWKLEKNKRLSILSNLSFIYISSVVFIILDQIYGDPMFFNINFDLATILNKIYLAVGLLLPILGIFIISFSFNFLKKINWNKDLFLYLIVIISSFLTFIFLIDLGFSALIFLLPILTIYIFRTLEFVEIKWLRLFYLSFFLLPAFIIYFDTSLYPNFESLPKINYLFYALILLGCLINPAFHINMQSFAHSYKSIIFSFLLITSISLSFIYLNYQNKFLHVGIAKTISEDLYCELDKTQITSNIEIPALNIYFLNTMYPSYFPDCEIQLLFTKLEEVPIDNPSSINKTLLDINQKSFINVNFTKK